MERSSRSSLLANLRGLGWPLLLGSAAYFCFLLGIKKGLITQPLVLRYFAGHPVSHVTTLLFLVGLAALLCKAVEVFRQVGALNRIQLDVPPGGRYTVDDAPRMLDQLEQLPAWCRSSYLGQRLHDALQLVRRRQSADGLEEHLKYLAEQDAIRQHESYALVRILIWAIPMLGFLGTVIGITMALEKFGRQDFSGENLNTAMDVLLSGLYVAFDTTALALSLSVVLMFVQFGVDRFETQLVATVDQQVADLLLGRFEDAAAPADPHVRTIDRMCRSVIRGSEQLVERQIQLWQSAMEQADRRWAEMAESCGRTLEQSLSAALQQSLQQHAEQIAHLDARMADQLRQRWEQWQLAMADNARLLTQQQEEMRRQTDTLTRLLQTAGDLVNLEKLLGENLKLLAGAKNFEETVLSLAAAIHLLTARLGHAPGAEKAADAQAKGKAA